MGRGFLQVKDQSRHEAHFLRYGSLNHWRGLAALMVVFYHSFWALAFKVEFTGITGLLQKASSIGYLGVHLFFVISGYCIVANIHRSALSRRTPGDFIRDRFLRIYPPYWAAFAFQVATMLLVAPFSNASSQGPVVDSFWVLAANLLLLEPYAGLPRGMVVSWTLVYEFGFYVLVGLGFAFSKWFGSYRGWAGVGIALAPISFFNLPQPAFLVLNYWPEFIFGGLVYLALLEKARQRGGWQWTFLATIPALTLAGVSFSKGEHIQHLPYAAGYALLLYFLAPFDRHITGAGWLRWLGITGAFSYSLYLIHIPILMPLSNLIRRCVNPETPALSIVILALWIVTIGGGYLFYRFCEIPMERWRFRARHSGADGLPLVASKESLP